MVQDIVCLAYGALRLCVDASLGGHIVEFSVDERNALSTQTTAIGSTFWPSPQDAWGWPPLAALDNLPYKVQYKSDKELVLTSGTCSTTGLQLEKRFRFEGGHLEVDYTMINTTDKPMKYAPWEITRIEGGVTFYQSKQKPLAISTGPVAQVGGFIWHEYKPKQQKQNEKIFGNGSVGWLANAYNGLLLVKKFEQVADKDVAPGEAEIEIYGHGDPKNAYIEMEQQGAYQTIAAKKSYQWRVEWYLAALPKGLDIGVGNKELPEAVKALLAK